MRCARGFTLAELMVVVGIMLVLMVAAFGIFGVLSEQGGPDNATLTVQAMLNGARDYAASNAVTTQVYFYVDSTKPDDGTQMKLQYLPLDSTGKPLGWADVIGRQPVPLHTQMYVCLAMPTSLPSAPAVSGAQVPTDNDLSLWKKFRATMLVALTSWAMTSSTPPTLNPSVTQFGVVFDPTGYLAMNQNPANVSGQSSSPIYAMTIIEVGGTKVTNYKFFVLNATSGSQVLFE